MFEALAIVLAATVHSYHVGNSLTYDGTVWLDELAINASADLEFGIHVDSSQSLHAIWQNPAGVNGIDAVTPPYGTWDHALANYQWDNVVFEPWLGSDATLGDDKAMITNFINYTRDNPANADTVFYVYQYWPQKNWGQNYWAATLGTTDATLSYPRAENYRYLMNWAQATFPDTVVREIPTGEVWYQLGKAIEAGEIPGVTYADLYRDDLHASWHLGRWAATATIYSTLMREEIVGISVPDGFTSSYPQSVYDKISEIVWDVVSSDPYSGVADFNNGGVVGSMDLATWQRGYGSEFDGRDFLNWQRSFAPSAGVADFNEDGQIDSADLAAWQTGYGNEFDGRDFLSWQRLFDPYGDVADFNNDGQVDGADLATWQDGYGSNFDGRDFLNWQRSFHASGAPAIMSVPEPSSVLALCSLGIFGFLGRAQSSCFCPLDIR